MRASLITLFAAVTLIAAGPPALTAQSAAIEGVARSAGDGAPIAFALVRLVPADAGEPAEPIAQGITSSDGRYRFAGMSQGRYRVQLLRIGFQPILSEPVQVANGETTQFDLRAASVPLTLPPVTVTPEVCITTKQFAAHPQLQTLWQQARDGASIRMGLMLRYQYHVRSREVSYEIRPEGNTPPYTLDQPYISNPKFAPGNADRRRARRLSQGYYYPNDGFGVADELDVLHDDFLKGHCLVPTVLRGDGELGVRFQPLRVRRDFLDVRGTIWLDSATYLVRRIEFEYVDGETPRGTLRLDFSDVDLAGGRLRMLVGGEFEMWPSKKNPARHTAGKLTWTYSDFVEVPAR